MRTWIVIIYHGQYTSMKYSYRRKQIAMRPCEVGKGDCIIMGDFNHWNIIWDTQQITWVEDQQFMCLVQDSFLTQQVLELAGENCVCRSDPTTKWERLEEEECNVTL